MLSAAINLGCGALVTGDRTHFGHLFGTPVQGVTVYSPVVRRSMALALTAMSGSEATESRNLTRDDSWSFTPFVLLDKTTRKCPKK